MRRQVVGRHDAAVLLQHAHDRGGDLAAVEGVLAARGHGAQRAGETRIAEALPGARRPAVDGHLAEVRRLALPLDAARPEVRRDLADRDALLGQADGRRQDVRHRQAAVLLDQIAPAGARARHGHGVGVKRRQLRDACRAQVLEGEAGRRAAGPVERRHLAGRRVVVEREAVAAQPGRRRLGDVERGGDRYRRVGRVAAGAQDRCAGLAGGDLARRHHAARAAAAAGGARGRSAASRGGTLAACHDQAGGRADTDQEIAPCEPFHARILALCRAGLIVQGAMKLARDELDRRAAWACAAAVGGQCTWRTCFRTLLSDHSHRLSQ